ncbi:hypothetical protein GCM10009715_43220 [Paeniglutamicibacter psychrophenolicus]|uniref:Secreted protein n=1 Tax=Paeniglutamicibacter psychrophenolicus TaxID=257454 RepID=A0ABS4WIZ2_9MICC|nr:hypothetical protein [Paeniglutamicibacter psychrophenolicus]MBP2376174.1 hypothetical protein [Paeniglutamicibacter psychrophenolicus]
MKQLLGLLLALCVLLPLCHTPAPAAVADSFAHAGISASAAPAAGATHCPTDAPTKQHCAPSADPQLNLAQIAPRPDASGAFGALPAALAPSSGVPRAQRARAPDLHALSISRT